LLLNNNFYPALFVKGNIYFNKRKYNDALKFYSKTIEINPKFSDAYLQRGITLKLLKKYKASLEDIYISLGLNPDNRRANATIGEVYLSQGKNEEGFRLKQEYEGNIKFSIKSGVEISGGFVNEETI